MTSTPSRRLAAALLSGLLLGASFPGLSIWPLALIAITPLILAAVAARSGGAAFLHGWIALTLSWLMTLPWVITVMTRYGGLPQLTGIVLYVAMCLVLGLYGGAFGWAAHRLVASRASSGWPWFLLPLAWAATEYGRTYLLSGFPWHLIATTTIDVPPVAVIASWIGPYGLGALVVGCSTLLAWMVCAGAARTRRLRVALISIVVAGALVTAGAMEIRRRDADRVQARSRAAMIQPNIPQEMRWDTAQLLAIFDRMMAMTREAADLGVGVVVWPESTVPLSFASTEFYREAVERLTLEKNVDIILGSVAEDPADPSSIWNSAYLVSEGRTGGRYDKIRLVPFGEYVPLRKVLFFAERLVRAVGEFRFGTSSVPLGGRWSYGPAICYEVVYPRLVAEQVRQGASVLVTITNDGWFGDSAAPVQHLRAVRMRAIETDRWFLRAATTGISAVIDPAGRVVDSLEMNRRGIVFGTFQPRTTKTLYAVSGDWFAIASCAIVIAALVARRKVVLR